MYKGSFQMAWTVTLLSVFAMAQATPLLTGVEPTTGRVGDAVTVPGENLGGSSIQEILLCKVSEDPPLKTFILRRFWNGQRIKS